MFPSDPEFIQCRVFHKVLSRWQKLWSRWRREKLMHRRNLRGPKGRVTKRIQEQETFCNLGLLDCISRILEQKLECLNRPQTSLNNFGFLGSFFFCKESWVAHSYWKPCSVRSHIFSCVYSHIQYCTMVLCRFKLMLHGTTWQIVLQQSCTQSTVDILLH